MNGGNWEMNAWSLIKTGGPIMVPLILCSIFALGIVIEKLINFTSINTGVRELKQQIYENIKNNKIKESIQLCEVNRSPVSKILKAGLVKFGSSRDEIRESMEDVSLYEIPRLEARLGALATIAHIAPLLGLLGTVTGMMACFQAIQMRSASLTPVTPGDLAGGIGEALLTTISGLLISIPTYVAYNYLVTKVNHFILEMERGATELTNYMCQFSGNNP